MVPFAVLVAAVLVVLSGMHVYWAFGGRWGHEATMPKREGRPAFQPGVVATLLVAGLLATAAVVLLGRVGLGPAAPMRGLTQIGAWTIAAVFLLRGVGDFRLIGLFRRVHDTRFAWWDRRLYTPLSFALGMSAAIIAAA